MIPARLGVRPKCQRATLSPFLWVLCASQQVTGTLTLIPFRTVLSIVQHGLSLSLHSLARGFMTKKSAAILALLSWLAGADKGSFNHGIGLAYGADLSNGKLLFQLPVAKGVVSGDEGSAVVIGLVGA